MTTHRRRAALLAIIGLIGTSTALATGIGPASAGPTTEIKPAALPKGSAGRVPHVDGGDLVVGARRYGFGDRQVVFLGTTSPVAGRGGTDYLVGVERTGKPGSGTVVRLQRDGDRSVVLSGVSPFELVLSSDGVHLFKSSYRSRSRTTVVRAWATSTGDQVAAPRFKGFATVLDSHAGVAVVGATVPDRTFSWDVATGATKRIAQRAGYHASIRKDRLAVLTGDPYLDGCSVLSTLARPGRTLWRSCTQAVTSFSPDGNRVLTTHLLADGLGPGEYQLRQVDGRHLRTFDAHYFGRAHWESDEVMLLDVHGKKRRAWVRCDDEGTCERTSRLGDNDF